MRNSTSRPLFLSDGHTAETVQTYAYFLLGYHATSNLEIVERLYDKLTMLGVRI